MVAAPGIRPPAGIDVPHPRPFALRLRAGSDETSRTVAHVSNVEYVRWLDRAAELHADAAGFTRASMAAAGHMWFVARHEVDYRAEAFEAERLVIATWVRNARKSLSWRDSMIFRPADRTIVCTAATLWIHVDLDARRPVPPPGDSMRAFEPLEAVRT